MRAIEGGQDAAAVFLNPSDHTFMSCPEIVQADQAPIEPGLIADQNDSNVFVFKDLERFESILIEAYFVEALHIIGTVHVQNAVAVQEEEAAVLRLWGA
jgi:hypothetical protein